MREAHVKRKTGETEVTLYLNVDGEGEARLETGILFLEHMLTLWAKFARCDLQIRARGDLDVDAHHTTEDIGLCLGEAFATALGDKEGIARFGDAIVPMDDALVMVALDLGGRPYFSFEGSLPAPRVGDFDTELVPEFLRAFASTGRLNLHVRVLAGRNTHHIMEGIFKALGRACAEAVKKVGTGIPSTKGVI
ncbi:MAG: imidazoleglycerol-phosphate dehydratase HisB [Bacillota bacterium]